jgi:transmembrane sensor
MTNPKESLEPQGDSAMAQASAWIARLGGDVSGEDGAEFDAWLDAAPGNRAAYRRAAGLMQAFGARAGDVLAALDALELPLETEAPARPLAASARGAQRRRPTVWRWAAPAGGLALAAGLAVALAPQMLAGPTTVATYVTARGEHTHLKLADGSLVDLDAATRLTVAMNGKERRLTLSEGQAIFDVAHDPNRPFVVAAGDRLVRDIGTQFDVKREPHGLTVTVARGRVSVERAAAPARAVVLGPGQRLALDDESGVGQLSSVDPAETFSWRAGRLVYRAAPLSDVVADLNRQFVEQTTVSDPELAKTPITGVIVLDNPRAVMSRLALMLPIKAVPSDKGLALQRK